MANNLVSDKLPVQSIQMGQLEYTSNKLDSPMQMGLTPGIGNSALQPISMSNVQMGLMKNDVLSQELSIQNNQALLESMPYSNVPRQLATSNMQLGQRELQAYNEVPGHYFFSNKQTGETILNNVGSQQSSLLNKRKAPMELMSSNSVSPKSTVANKRMAQMEHRPWLQHISTPNRLPVQVQQVSNTSGSQHSQVPSKWPALSKSGSQQTSIQKNQSGQRQPTPKSQNEPLVSVRSKLRESLAAALALVSQQQDKISSGGKNFQSEATCSMEQTKENLQPLGQNFGVDATRHAFEKSSDSLPSKEDFLAQRGSNGEKISQDTANGNARDSAQAARKDVQELRSSMILQHEDLSFSDSFFAKDELLQGNGLSWVLEPNMEIVGREDIEIAQKQLDQKSTGKNKGGEVLQTPEDLASKIEAELFKLFGGVNKKYKEKGRSLLFNLKDRNNPELSERVMSGEIPPERLCSMTAEELASKELSQWRMAKAEELAQMVVLPDSDVDIRRLVKKTHKGEFQVEVDQQDNVSVEVAVGVSSVPSMQPKLEEKAVSPKSKPDTAKDNHRKKLDQVKDKIRAASANSKTEEKDVPCTITISSNEGTDLMQGLMVDDELKDAEFLPPIVSLDEFMESLNSEPPFEHLPGNNGKTMPFSDKDNLQVDSESKSPDATPVEATQSIPDKPDDIDVKHGKLDYDRLAIANLEKSGVPVGLSEGKPVWEGSLQLNTSATASVFGIYKCGEKTSVKEWPGFIEIKGRVRLDAFEKFLQELPMSRSRAVMAVHLVCKEGSAESECSSLREVADSYVVDGRVGLAEPARGFELYLCPPHSRTREMLSKVLPEDQLDALNAIDNGLIGVIVWRKAQISSTLSPNSASHHKHNMKKHFTSRRHQEKDTNTDVNITPKHALSRGGPPAYPKPQPDENDDEDDDDVPPGFGPLPTRDEDDLPEFNFLSGSIPPRSQTSHKPIQGPGMTPFHPHAQTPTRPVDQMRELVQRYGQPETSVTVPAMQSWNDDDDEDDDMPEWRPESAHSQPPLVHGRRQPMLRVHMVQQSHHQQVAPTGITSGVNLQPQVNVMHGLQGTTTSWQQGGWMVSPSGTNGPPPYQPNGGQNYGSSEHGAGQQGMTWRRDAPISKGF